MSGQCFYLRAFLMLTLPIACLIWVHTTRVHSVVASCYPVLADPRSPHADACPSLETATFYSQHNQDLDKIVYTRYFQQPCIRHGVVVEVGAFDGLQGSNGRFFEEQLGWRGVCVEGNPTMFKQLLINRPLCQNVNAAVALNESKAEYIVLDAHRSQKSGLLSSYGKGEKTIKKGIVTVVETKPLSLILRELGIRRVDFLSIDVEGGEMNVLLSVDWDEVQVRTLTVEMDDDKPEKNSEIRSFLKLKGFAFVIKSRGDEIFVHASVPEV